MARTRTARLYPTDSERERAYLVGVELRGANGRRSWSSMEELALLARTAGADVAGMTVQRLDRPNPAHYIGRGKLEELVAERERLGYSIVIFDDELTPSQQRTLEKALKVKVLDRTALILDIFAMRARTREGRLQVDLAQSEYLLPRLAGQWSHLERLGGRSGAPGAIGVRGPGETQLETDRRLVRNKIARLKAEIERVRRHRALYRRRRARTGVPVVALVGYTNAGKSTLMRALTSADVLVEDQLFATLDPVTRRMTLPSGAHALLTDTVGFIQKLPTQLVAAFRATLEELADADMLLHVVDITHPDAAERSQTVDDTLADLGLAGKPRVVALNKIDRLVDREGRPVEGPEELGDLAADLQRRFPNAVLISAERRWGLNTLIARVEETLVSAAASPAGFGQERWAAS
ncbi:MAG TPA: GTPase HflX [Dehalococcoidia bacterium]|nr:GTPase HflX [Dehalococcoidia bacterium]